MKILRTPDDSYLAGAHNQPHITLSGSHFIQEEDGETWARAVLDWMAK